MNQEFVLLYGEVAEAYEAWKHKGNIGDELADVAIYLLGIAELNNISLIDEINRKVEVNDGRKYLVDSDKNAFKSVMNELHNGKSRNNGFPIKEDKNQPP